MTPRRANLLLWLILAVQLALGVGWTAVTPLWQGHETDYLNVLRFLTTQGRLPTPEDYPPGRADIEQVTQGPTYYLTAAPVVALLDSGAPLNAGLNPLPLCIGAEGSTSLLRAVIPSPEQGFPPQGAAATGYGLRLLNLALGMAAVVFTFAAGRTLFPQRPALALTGAALLAFEPSTLRMMTFISNETLLLMLAAASLYAAARLMSCQPVRWRWAALLFVLSGLAVLTRLTGWAVLGFNLLVLLALAGRLLWSGLRGRASRRQAWIALGVLAALVLGVVGIASFNLATTGSLFGRYSFLDERIGRVLSQFDLSPLVIGTVFDQTRLAFLEPIEALGAHRRLQLVYVFVPLLALGGALLALIVAVVARLRRRPAALLGALLLLWAAFLIGAGLVLVRNFVDIPAHGGITAYNAAAAYAPIRYYAPALPAFGLLLAFGAWTWMRWAGQAIGLVSARAGQGVQRAAWLPGASLAVVWGAVMLGILALAARAGATPPSYTPEQAQALPGVTWLDDSAAQPGVPRVLGFAAAPGEQPGLTALTLYAMVDEVTGSALGRVLMGVGSGEATACEFVPGRGTLPVPVWEPGLVYAISVQLPTCEDVPDDALDLSVQWQVADASGALTGDPSALVALGPVPAPEPLAAGCVSLLGRIAGFTVVKAVVPESARLGEPVLPSINWIIEAETPGLSERVYTFTHDETGQAFTCTRVDGGLDGWQRGTYRYFDRCVFTFPDDAPPGTYTVSVMLRDASSALLPATGPSGEPLAGGQLPLGQITLQP